MSTLRSARIGLSPAALALIFVFIPALLQAQRNAETFRMRVSDPDGAVPEASCELVNRAGGAPQRTSTDANGICTWRDLTAGAYRARVTSAGFRPAELAVKIVPGGTADASLVLQVAAANTTIDVSAGAESENVRSVGRSEWQMQASSQPGRELLDTVRRQPGWLLEANGVLHPRGSEYDTQYIVDGVPLLENRSPAFAPALDLSSVQDLAIQTGGYPAAYGRKLGGVVEVHEGDYVAEGWHGTAELSGGAFDTQSAAVAIGFGGPQTAVQLNATGGRTDRFLDPATIENFNNHGHTGEIGLAVTHRFDAYKRLRIELRRAGSGFQVPNEIEQQAAGQNQTRETAETSGQAWYQQILSPSWVLDMHASARLLGASLEGNAASTPILPWQNRGLREFYSSGALAGHRGRHDVGFGIDFIRTALRENFRYTITDPSAFDPDVLPTFAFAQRASGNQASWYAQDRISAGPLTVNAGLRWDYYDFLLRQTAWSPRFAAAFRIKPMGMMLHGSFDRIFNTPAMENLLLASSPAARAVTPASLGFPVPPGHGNFFEVGAARDFGSKAHFDLAAFRRDFHNYSDDDVFLNTGVSFPISFSRAQVEGIEAALRLALASKISAQVNYSNLSGRAWLPVTGGLFLEGAGLLQSNTAFRISQDQRNTASWFLRYQATNRVWVGGNGLYGSGLPVELEDGAARTNDPRILNRVDLARGRLRPSISVGVAAGAVVWTRNDRAATLQFNLDNLTNHLNVINFAGLFSGTALGTPRALSAKLRYTF